MKSVRRLSNRCLIIPKIRVIINIFTIVTILKYISKSRLASLKKLKQKKYRAVENKFLIEGEKIIKEVLGSGAETELILATEHVSENNLHLISLIKSHYIPLEFIHSRDAEQLSDVITPQGIFGIVKIKENKISPDKFDGNTELIILDSITDPGNLGTIIRTAHWFGMNGIVIGRQSIDLFNPKVIRASMGSLFHISVWHNSDIKKDIKELKKCGFTIFAAHQEGSKSLAKLKKTLPKVIVFGSESHGISEEILKLCDDKIQIAGFNRFDSLNLSVAAGILMWEMKR